MKWIRRIIIVLLIIAVGYQFIYIDKLTKEVKGFFGTIFETIEPKPDFDKYRKATIEIKVGKPGGAGVIFKIDNNHMYILTVNHIFKNNGRIDIQLRDKHWNKVKIENISRENLYRDRKADLALLKIPRPEGDFVFLPVADRPAEIGDKIYTIGHPLRFFHTIMKGIVSNFVKRIYNNKKIEYMMISVSSFNGNSGGAVVDTRGKIVGIVSGVMYLDKIGILSSAKILINQLTFAVKIEDIKRLIKEVENK